MSGFDGYVKPVVVAPVHVEHGSCYELCRRQIVDCRERDGYVVAADLLDVAVRVDPHATVAAEHVVVGTALAEAVLAGVFLTGEQTKRVGLGPHRPRAHLPAVTAVAFARAFGEIEIGFESNLSAVAASPIGFLRHRDLLPRPRELANRGNGHVLGAAPVTPARSRALRCCFRRGPERT